MAQEATLCCARLRCQVYGLAYVGAVDTNGELLRTAIVSTTLDPVVGELPAIWPGSDSRPGPPTALNLTVNVSGSAPLHPLLLLRWDDPDLVPSSAFASAASTAAQVRARVARRT